MSSQSEDTDQHLDDFLNGLAEIELAAAFSLRARQSGLVKRNPEEWEKAFKAFSKEIPN